MIDRMEWRCPCSVERESLMLISLVYTIHYFYLSSGFEYLLGRHKVHFYCGSGEFVKKKKKRLVCVWWPEFSFSAMNMY